jgi:hypothetical protein
MQALPRHMTPLARLLDLPQQCQREAESSKWSPQEAVVTGLLRRWDTATGTLSLGSSPMEWEWVFQSRQ